VSVDETRQPSQAGVVDCAMGVLQAVHAAGDHARNRGLRSGSTQVPQSSTAQRVIF